LTIKELFIEILEELAEEFDSIVSRGQRSKVIAKLIEEVRRHKDKLYKAALKLEKK
jgi:metal-responsive CopG/Arc/MetJ family transcriptional regulator